MDHASFDQAIREVTAAFKAYRFTDANVVLIFWSEFCDWYVESCKATFFGEDAARKANVLAVFDFVMGHTLRLFHPFPPFITEELWHGLGYSEDMPADQGGETIMTAHWLTALDEDFMTFYGLEEIWWIYWLMPNTNRDSHRNLRTIGNILFAKKADYILKPAGTLDPYEVEVIQSLLNAEGLEVNPDYAPRKGNSGLSLGAGRTVPATRWLD